MKGDNKGKTSKHKLELLPCSELLLGSGGGDRASASRREDLGQAAVQ